MESETHNFPRPRSSTPWGLIFGIGCGGCSLLLIMVIGGGVFLFKAGTEAYREVDPVARQFAAHVFSGDSDSAYAMLGKQWKQRQSQEQFDAWVEYCRKSIGGQPELTFAGYHVFAGTGGNRQTLTYKLTYGPNTGTLQVVLMRESNQLRIEGANFSPGG